MLQALNQEALHHPGVVHPLGLPRGCAGSAAGSPDWCATWLPPATHIVLCCAALLWFIVFAPYPCCGEVRGSSEQVGHPGSLKALSVIGPKRFSHTKEFLVIDRHLVDVQAQTCQT